VSNVEATYALLTQKEERALIRSGTCLNHKYEWVWLTCQEAGVGLTCQCSGMCAPCR